MSDSIEQQVNKEVHALTLIDELARLLKDDGGLQDAVAERLASSNSAKEVRGVIMNRRAAQSYYNEEYALSLKPHLDLMIDCGLSKPIEFPRTAFPGVSLQTVYLRVYQAWQWLRDHHADRTKYIELYYATKIQQRPATGVRIIKRERLAPAMTSILVEPKFDDIAPLHKAISEALAKPQELEVAIVFDKKNLSLSDDDQNNIKDSLVGVEGLTVRVTDSQVLIMRRLSQNKEEGNTPDAVA